MTNQKTIPKQKTTPKKLEQIKGDTMTTKFCNICGAECSGTDTVCPICGADLTSSVAQAAKATPVTRAPKKQEISQSEPKDTYELNDEPENEADDGELSIFGFTTDDLGITPKEFVEFGLTDEAAFVLEEGVSNAEAMDPEDLLAVIKEGIQDRRGKHEIFSVIKRYSDESKVHSVFTTISNIIYCICFGIPILLFIIALFSNGVVRTAFDDFGALFSDSTIKTVIGSTLVPALVFSALFTFVISPLDIVARIVTFLGVKNKEHTFRGTKKKYAKMKGNLNLMTYEDDVDFFIAFKYDTVAKIVYVMRKLFSPLTVVTSVIALAVTASMLITLPESEFVSSFATPLVYFSMPFINSLIKFILKKIYKARIKSVIDKQTKLLNKK